MLLASLSGGTALVLGRKIALTLGVLVVAGALRVVLGRLEDRGRARLSVRTVWTRKFIGLTVGFVAAVAIGGVWFDKASNVATFTGLVGAGIAFASQQALLSVAAFFVIVFGRVFNIGERIEMGGVRGDVLDIGLLKTTVMEMGVPQQLLPDPNHWVAARQYTGRIVTLTNARIFSEPVFNLSRNFEFLWDELRFPLKYGSDWQRAERIAVQAVRDVSGGLPTEAAAKLGDVRRHFLVREDADVQPHAYIRLTDNWIELSLRFVCRPHGVRALKDRISREVLQRFQAEGIEIASSTFEVVGLPKLEVEEPAPAPH